MATAEIGGGGTAVRRFEYIDERTLRATDGSVHDVLDAVGRLPWVRQWCPFMPHEYAILGSPQEQAWHVVEAMIRLSPQAYRAFFRGYQSANRYWDAPDGKRYWRARFEIDRWDASETEGLRRRDDGAHAIKEWDGPRHAPNGAGYYVQDANGRWWPTARFFAEGYKPCRACQRTPRAQTKVSTPAYRGPSSLMGAASATQDSSQPAVALRLSPEIRGVIERLLDLREEAAPLGDSTYRGPFTQALIAKIAGVPVKTVTAMAIARDRRRNAGEQPDGT